MLSLNKQVIAEMEIPTTKLSHYNAVLQSSNGYRCYSYSYKTWKRLLSMPMFPDWSSRILFPRNFYHISSKFLFWNQQMALLNQCQFPFFLFVFICKHIKRKVFFSFCLENRSRIFESLPLEFEPPKEFHFDRL